MITAADVIDVAPEFGAESVARINRFIARALPYINPRIWGIKTDYAHALFTAHLLKGSGSASGGGPVVIPAGPVTKEKMGDLEISYASATISSPSSFETTNYGQLFLQLRRTVSVSPLVAG